MFRFNQGMVLALCLFAGAYAQAQTVVPAPCSDDKQAGLKSCQEYIFNGSPANGTIPAFPPVAPNPVPTNGQIYTQIQTTILGNPAVSSSGNPSGQLKGWYQHVDPDPINPPGPNWAPNICNLVPGPFNNNASEGNRTWTGPGSLKNILGDSCGNPIVLACQGHSNCGITGCSPTVSTQIHKEGNSDPNKSRGTLEDGYGYGGLAAATACYMQQVISEIQKSHQLTVMDEGTPGHASPCATAAGAATQLTGTIGGDVQALQAQLTGAQNISDIANCAQTGAGGDALRQGAQQLCGHRAAMEAAFIQLAACEIFARAQYSYMKQLGSAQGITNITQFLTNSISSPCSSQCQNQLNPSITNQPSDSDITNCANSCYLQKLPGAYQNFLQNLWPGDGSGHCDPLTHNQKPTESLPPFGGMFMIGMLGQLRRKKSGSALSRNRRSPTGLLRTLGVAGICLGLSLGWGCGSDDSVASTPATCDGCSAGNADCLSNPGAIPNMGPTGACNCTVAPSGPNCPPPTPPGTKPIGGTLLGAFQGIGSGQGGVRAETALVARDLPVMHGNGGPALSQPVAVKATAGDISPNVAAPKIANVSVPDAGPGANTPGGRIAPQGFAASGSGLGAGFGEARTAAATDDGAKLGAAGGSDPNAAGGMYKSGNGVGGPAAAGEGGLGAFGRKGLSADGAEGTGSTEESFNADMNGTKGGTVASSDDPADYFTRLGLNDNLFKVVERRYRQKSTRWVTDDLAKPNPAIAPDKKPKL